MFATDQPPHNTTQRNPTQPNTSASPLRARLQAAESYAEYKRLCLEVDREEGTLPWREEERDMPQAVLLRRTIEELEAALKAGNLPHLKFLLGGLFRARTVVWSMLMEEWIDLLFFLFAQNTL